jgi:hypothetical protein
MAKRKHEFSEADKVRVLLWCGRHCCLIGKMTGVGMEVAHLETGRSDIDNAIPLCFDCHAAIGHYNRRHPRGRKFSIAELKARRDQVYEQHTRHLVPPVQYSLTQEGRTLPDLGFQISNLGNTYPIRARIEVNLFQGIRAFGPPETSGHYNGKYVWNLNPGFGVSGHFNVPAEMLQSTTEPMRARIDVTLIDIYDREHKLLPVGYVHALGTQSYWYFEPSEEELSTTQRPKTGKNASSSPEAAQHAAETDGEHS